jgi:hypothetical protein
MTMKPTPRILAAGLCFFALPATLFADDKDGVMMKGGKVMTMEDGKKTELTGDRTLENGTKITTTGNVTTPDGKTFQLKDGDLIADDGTFHTRVVSDGIVKKDGKIMKVTAGEKSELSAEATLADGTKVMTNGDVVGKDGKKWNLDENDAILNDGRVLLEGSVIMKDSKPLLVKDCLGKPIEDEVSLDGTKVRPDGAVTKKDGGGETALKDGDIVKTDGTILRAGGGTE